MQAVSNPGKLCHTQILSWPIPWWSQQAPLRLLLCKAYCSSRCIVEGGNPAISCSRWDARPAAQSAAVTQLLARCIHTHHQCQFPTVVARAAG